MDRTNVSILLKNMIECNFVEAIYFTRILNQAIHSNFSDACWSIKPTNIMLNYYFFVY